jgi:lipopolysaccharide export system permease protein
MRPPRTISLYIMREVLLYAFIGLALVSVVFIGQNLLRFLAQFLMIGVLLSDILAIVKCVVVATLAYTVPIAFLFGVLAGIGRMAADTEITALRSCGVGLRDPVLPVFGLGFLVSCFTWYVALDVEHRMKRELRDVLMSMTATGTMIEPQRFKQVEGRVIYVESRDRQNRLEGIFISDHSDRQRPILIFAEYGEFAFDPDTQEVRILLHNGDLHFEGRERSADGYERLSFLSFDYVFRVNFSREVGFRWVKPKDMTMEELRGVIARARAGESLRHLAKRRVEEYEVQIQRRYALPVAPMLFALTAVPLSLRRGRGARSWGALLCGLLVGVYYGILTFSQYLAVEGLLPVALALWSPNVAFALAGGFLLHRSRRLGG